MFNTPDRDPLGMASMLNVSSEMRRQTTEAWENWKGNPRECVAVFRSVVTLLSQYPADMRINPELSRIASHLNMILLVDKLGTGTWSLLIQDGLHSLYLDTFDLLLGVVWGSDPQSKVCVLVLVTRLSHLTPCCS